jgi:hypothetical protein
LGQVEPLVLLYTRPVQRLLYRPAVGHHLPSTGSRVVYPRGEKSTRQSIF